MNPEKKTAVVVILLVFFFFLGFSLVINLPVLHRSFLSADQQVYFAMTQSMAHDLDIEYTKKDLIRYYESFDSGPQGIFLKRVKTDSGEKIYYAKSWAYSLFTAPFVRVFGYNGFLVFHALLLLLVLLAGFSYLSLWNRPVLSLITVITFLFASIACVYYLWMTPDFFNLAVAFLVLFLWLYKIKRREESPSENAKSGFHGFLLTGWSDCLAAVLAGVATFSKPPNIVLMAPLVLWNLARKKYLKSLLLTAVFLLTVGLFFGANFLMTSDWNYQGGERKTFVGTFPLEKAHLSFDNLGFAMTSEGYLEKFFLPLNFIFPNLFYYFFGRFTGVVWYFFPAVLALGLFALGRRRLQHWLILAALTGEILIYVILMPDNYGGGGGSLANRYFLCIYPFFFFLPAVAKTRKEIILSWAMAAVFISQILVSPFRSSADPATHAKQFPFKLLPVEMTQVNNFPTNTNPRAFRVTAGTPPHTGFMHFLDDNFIPKLEPTGVWTRGSGACEIILKTYYPLKEIAVHLLNNPRMNNAIKVRVGGETKKITLQPRQRGTLRFAVESAFQVKAIHLYKIKIKASKASIPYLEDELSDERRNLGVFFELELIPRK